MFKIGCIICDSCRIVLDTNPPSKPDEYIFGRTMHICKKECKSEYSSEEDLSWTELKEAIAQEWKDLDEERNRAVAEFDKKHKRCPKCKNEKHISQTYTGPVYIAGEPYEDNINYATCPCGWHGKVNQLIP